MRLKAQGIAAEDKEVHEAKGKGNARNVERYRKAEAFQSHGDERRDEIVAVNRCTRIENEELVVTGIRTNANDFAAWNVYRTRGMQSEASRST